MTFHRAESHALFYLTLASPLIAWGVARLSGEADRFRRWWLAVWLVLVTHPLLDAMTVYGTQIALPFTNHPYAVGSIFIIDPLYTVPLLIGVILALALRKPRGLRWNAAGLAVSSAYLAWSVLAQQYVARVADEALASAGIEADRVLVGPTAFNTVLWRILVVTHGAYYEGFYSLLDEDRSIAFDRFERDTTLYAALRDDWHVARIAWFSHGFFDLRERGGEILISDLRMGQEPAYTFTFVVARRGNPGLLPVTPRMVAVDREVGENLRRLWRRLQGERSAAPPRETPRPRGVTS